MVHLYFLKCDEIVTNDNKRGYVHILSKKFDIKWKTRKLSGDKTIKVDKYLILKLNNQDSVFKLKFSPIT